uniref:Uncharacterized protein n=1 Tax=Rhizophora mucronata TaxID=61149 RepID=A0A2P2Q9C9_RHIMU
MLHFPYLSRQPTKPFCLHLGCLHYLLNLQRISHNNCWLMGSSIMVICCLID